MGEEEKAEKLMIVFRTAPYGTIYAFEGLENVLIMGAYDQDISVLFIDDGIYAIKDGMNTEGTGIKNFSPTFRALEAYDIEKVYVDKESLEARGLSVDDLVIEPEIIDASQVAQMMEDQKNFFIF
ncbi:MAG: sulfurtransferase complex subunit TusC [Gaiellales bacterium]|nr:MAG: sulfurtransferase complex subunit TusC [Gaiellales bacterium]